MHDHPSFLPSQIPPNLHRKPLQKPTSLYHRKNNTNERRRKDPNERYHDPAGEEATGENVVGEEHWYGDLSLIGVSIILDCDVFLREICMTYKEIHDQC